MVDRNDGVTLVDLRDGQEAVIISVTGGRTLTKRLADLGLNKGSEIKVMRKTLFSGPLQVEVCGSKLVIGRGLASRIKVVLK